MPIEWKIEQGNLAEFEVSKQLGIDEFQNIQTELGHIARKLGQVRVLVILKDFAGWEASRDWGDISATAEMDKILKKMAIVGDEEWRDLVEVFTLKGLRPVPIEYFNDEGEARRWLDSD